MKGIRSTLHQLRAERPGRRFRRARRDAAGAKGTLGRPALVLLGIVLVAAGLFFMAVPGPGLLILVAGLFLISLASRRTAHLLDRSEVILRRIANYAWKRWTEAPVVAKILLLTSGALLTAAVGYALVVGFLQGN